ncbi:MAG: hypothetical protein ACM31G_09725 [Flavobacteriales bacterium]
MQEFIEIVEKHLSTPQGVISIEQGKKKLAKEGSITNKFNWTKQDILNVSSGVKDFIEQLPNKGFTDGTTLFYRKIEADGIRSRTKATTTLKFPNTPAPQSTENHTQNTPMVTQQTPQTPQQPFMAAPVLNGMAYAQLPQHDVISMMVKNERYEDLVKKWKDAEDENRELKSKLRMEEEKRHDAERKLSTQDEKWDLKLERELNSKKGFLDTETGKEVVGALAGSLPQILAALKPQPVVGMGNPLAMLPIKTQQLIQLSNQIQETGTDYLLSVAKALMEVDGFDVALANLLKQANQEE